MTSIMSTTKSLEQQIRDIQLPQIDIHDSVMHTISSKKQPINIFQSKLLVASVICILLIGTGFASLKYMKLYNDKGEEWVNIQPYNQQHTRPNTDTNDFNEYLSLLNEGEAIAVFNPINNDGQVVSVLTKPITYMQWNDFKEKVGNRFPLPKVLDAGFSFNSGGISLTAVMQDNKKLIQESMENGNKITYEKVDVLDQIAFISMSLLKESHEYTISMFNGPLWDTVYTDMLNSPNLQKIVVHGTEGIVATNSDESEAIWRSSAEHGDVFYSITTTNKTEQVANEIVSLLSMLLVNNP